MTTCMLNLEELRKGSKLSMDKLSQISGVSRTYIGQLERAEYLPTVDVCCRLCRGLGVTPNDMIKEEYYR